MSDFSFTATARCDMCGKYLSSSTEKCDHGGAIVETHVFREIGGGIESLVEVSATAQWKWYRLKDKVNDDWVRYEYLGPRDSVLGMIDSELWENVEDLPKMSMSLDAPADVADYNE